MIGAAGEIVLPRRAKHQPSPEVHKGGDCGACSLGGALGIEVSDCYSRFDSEGITHIGEMARCIRCAASCGLADRIIEEPAEWPSCQYFRAFGSPAVNESLAWFNYVRMAIDSGYYGLAEVDFNANGGPETNHWILIAGARTDGAVTGKLLTGEVLTSCSVRGEKWVEAREFLSKMGGYNALFVRPK